MNHLKTNPVGIDFAIEQLQKPLYKRLDALGEVNGFGRAYKNKRSRGFILEAFDNGEYKDVMGGEDSRFYFYLHNELNGDKDLTARVDIICMVNLEELMNSTERKDEEFRAIVVDEIQKSRFNLQKIILGTDYIHGLVSKPFEDTSFPYSDIHPNHAVTFQTEVHYKLKTC